MEIYQVRYIDGAAGDINWETVTPLLIQNMPWGGTYAPETKAWLIQTGDRFCLRMQAVEPKEYLRAEERGISDLIHTDSCMEFFFIPEPDRNRDYINLEFNPAGAVHIAVGPNREERKRITEMDLSILHIRPFANELPENQICWGFTADIPFAWIASLIGKEKYRPGKELYGNFYKCGDKTPKPHYLVWNPVEWPHPDYHRPEFFGRCILK